MLKQSLFFFAAYLLTSPMFGTPVTYAVAVDTSSVRGISGSIDFQFNPGALSSQSAFLQVLNFSAGGTLNPANRSTQGDVSGGPLPSALTFDNNNFALNEYFQGFTYGSKLLFNVSLYGPALTSPNGSPGGSLFAFSMFSDAAGTAPVLTSDATYGIAFAIAVNANGTTTLSSNSTQASIMLTPEPTALTLTGLALLTTFVLRRAIFRRVTVSSIDLGT